MPIERLSPSVPPLLSTWQVAQAVLLSPERRGSSKRRPPSDTFLGSRGTDSGMGEMGSAVSATGADAEIPASDDWGASRIAAILQATTPVRARMNINQLHSRLDTVNSPAACVPLRGRRP